MTSLIGWPYLLLGTIIDRYLTCATPTALDLAEANATSVSFLLPPCLFRQESTPHGEKFMTASLSIALQWVLPKPTVVLKT